MLSVPPTDLSIDSLPIRQTIQVKEPSNAYSFITPEDPCKKRKCYLKMDVKSINCVFVPTISIIQGQGHVFLNGPANFLYVYMFFFGYFTII